MLHLGEPVDLQKDRVRLQKVWVCAIGVIDMHAARTDPAKAVWQTLLWIGAFAMVFGPPVQTPGRIHCHGYIMKGHVVIAGGIARLDPHIVHERRQAARVFAAIRCRGRRDEGEGHDIRHSQRLCKGQIVDLNLWPRDKIALRDAICQYGYGATAVSHP